MYCSQCQCEYLGWDEKCPVCQTNLLPAKPTTSIAEPHPLAYSDLVDAVREHDETLTFEMSATSIVIKRGRRFPYTGRGYAWTKQFVGFHEEIVAHLTTTEVGRDRKWTFPYFGYGFAWENEIHGNVSGNPLGLRAEKVAREHKMRFPYLGYGYAWVQTMIGECGEELNAVLTITEVQKRKKWGFPYFGFGFAWVNAGKLTLSLAA